MNLLLKLNDVSFLEGFALVFFRLKLMHFPVTFVIKTKRKKELVLKDLDDYIDARANGMKIIESRYRKAIGKSRVSV